MDDHSQLYLSGQSLIADTNEINGTVPGLAPLLQILTTIEVLKCAARDLSCLSDFCFMFTVNS